MHHVKEEEGELFQQLQSARLDWETIASEMRERRAELVPTESEGLMAEGGSEGGTQMKRQGRSTNGRGEGASSGRGD